MIFDFTAVSTKLGRLGKRAAIFKTAIRRMNFPGSAQRTRRTESAFTNSIEDLQSRMMLTAPKGRTALLDAIYLGTEPDRGARNGKSAPAHTSDGGDNHSRTYESDIKRL